MFNGKKAASSPSAGELLKKAARLISSNRQFG
jgi:hypothetical protein